MATTKISALKKRKNVRFKPDPTQVAFIEVTPKRGSSFQPQIPALIVEESASGCGLVVLGADFYSKQICRLQVGKLQPLKAEVRWVKVWDKASEHQVSVVGFLYLE